MHHQLHNALLGVRNVNEFRFAMRRSNEANSYFSALGTDLLSAIDGSIDALLAMRDRAKRSIHAK